MNTSPNKKTNWNTTFYNEVFSFIEVFIFKIKETSKNALNKK